MSKEEIRNGSSSTDKEKEQSLRTTHSRSQSTQTNSAHKQLTEFVQETEFPDGYRHFKGAQKRHAPELHIHGSSGCWADLYGPSTWLSPVNI